MKGELLMRKLFLVLFVPLMVLFLAACGNETNSTVEADNKGSNETSAAQNEAGNEESYVLSLAHGYSTTHYMHTFSEWFNEEVQKRSDGRLSIDIFPNAQLMPHDQEIVGLVQGQVDMIHGSSPALTSFDPIWNFFELPFIFDYDPEDPTLFLEERTKFNQHELGGKKVAARMEEKGVKILGIGYVDSFGAIFTSNKKVTDVGSAKGLRIRAPGGIITPETMKALGASSMTIAGAEAITALQQGVVDGLLTTPLYAYDTKLPVKHYTVAPLFNPVTPMMISVSKFESLPSDLQEILVETGKDFEQYVKETLQKDIVETLPKLEKERGVEFYYPTEEEIDEMKEATKSSWELFEKEVEGGKELIDALPIINGKN